MIPTDTGRPTGLFRTLILTAAVSIALAGCARFRPQPLSPAANAASLDRRSLDDPRLQRFLLVSLSPGQAAPAPRWNLDTLTLAALYYHPDLAVAGARLAAARAGVVTARERPNPTLNFAAILQSGVAFPAGAAPITIGPVINFLIETFGKRADRTAQAQHLAAAARADLATTAWLVRGRVRTALLDLWAAQGRLKLARQQIALLGQLVSLLEQRFAAGYATALDVTRERIALAQTSLNIRDVNRLEAAARVRLATAVGVPVSALDGVQLSVAAFDHPRLPGASLAAGPLRRRALTERTDVQASLARYAAAQSALRLQMANQYPNLLLGPGYNYDAGTNKFILNPAINFPILNQNQGPIAQALAARQQAAARFTALQAQIIGQIDAAAAAYRTTTQALHTGNRLLAQERLRQRDAKAEFAAGALDRPALVTAELEAAVIRSARFTVLVQQRQALGAIEDALQRPIFDPHAPLFSGPRSILSLAAERG